MEEETRKTGIDIIGAVPWGKHLCQFYYTKQDLLDILVPFFKAGLENNELCMWVTSEPLNEKEAEEVMRKAGPNFAQYLKKGQIDIVPYTEWYLKDGIFNPQRVLNAWTDKLEQALVKGYDGMRATGDTAWVEKEDWRNFIDYEEEINNVLSKYRMLVICTYPLSKCGVSEVMDVVKNHQFALIRREGEWELIESGERKRAEEALRQSEERLHTWAETLLDGFAIFSAIRDEAGHIVDFRYDYINESGCQLNQRTYEEQIGHTLLELLPKHKDTGLFDEYVQVVETGQLLAKESLVYEDVFGGGQRLARVFDFKAVKLDDGFAVDWRDITEQQQSLGKQQMASTVTSRGSPLTSLEERFIKLGFEGLDEQETIELLLSLVIPHRKCKCLAKECIEHFKNVRGLLSALPEELEQVGLSHHGIFLIKLLHELPEEVLKEKIIERPVNKSSQEIFDYLYYSMRDLKKEVFKVIYLNSQNQIIEVADLFEGTIESTPVHPREIVEAAIKHNAVSLIFVHNHPSGDPTPSKSDKQLTRDLVFIGSVILIKVLDHIIIGENRYFSFADAGLIKKYEDDFLNIRIKKILQAKQYQYVN